MELDELYREAILDHARHPRNFGDLPGSDRSASATNVGCGDAIRLTLRLSPEGSIEAIRFRGSGCAISTASASLLTLAVRGKSAEEAQALCAKIQRLLTGGAAPEDDLPGELAALAGVRRFPQRVGCALLAWHALDEALRERGQTRT
ncbi:Iron-sulfur cluster assembly scaffold protein IscU [Methylacidimicrobium cyclopophantes]|uniref:Iron-sulfur cluster assembly scaffold protein IscU n=1 Tax=Methylacidimicrobium cyclopophantes TaxID=1041766 RepID=A0A5E6MBC1_9BACT|nr:SUF system NifU family Fe-S cluster assembly protein [Methylacidimicrobium cyclopophantes]VVM06270.1 Iron-sulfur cluster assembly scaffold protein IscU [Methylacidimicrobium cyclopophantes]